MLLMECPSYPSPTIIDKELCFDIFSIYSNPIYIYIYMSGSFFFNLSKSKVHRENSKREG